MEQTVQLPKPEIEPPKPENGKPKPLPPVRDGRIRALLIPAFGTGIPHLTGYFGPYRPPRWQYWVGLVFGNLISFLIWHGNRWLLLKQRQHYDWFDFPIRKIVLLLFANVFYTAPLTVTLMLGWYRVAGFGPDWNVIRTVTLACVICVVFITHVYETVYLIQQREDDLVGLAQLERARIAAQLEALKAQVAPHFLFNSLNTLSWLIENSPPKAAEFNQNLAEVYRYILAARSRELVPLAEEWEFARRYWELVKLRFQSAVELDWSDPGERAARWFVPPISIQVLLENAVKHNGHSAHHPLQIGLSFEGQAIVVQNRKQPRLADPASAGVGLRTLDERCRIALGRGIDVIEESGRFTVRLPVKAV